MTVPTPRSRIRNPNAARLLAHRITHGQVTVTTDASRIIEERDGRQSVILRNRSEETVFIGSINVTADDGFSLDQNDSMRLDTDGEVWAIVASGTADVRFIEEL
ncbi:MAG: hypothetical protein ACOC9T_01000 [Myxococcota bacterium]